MNKLYISILLLVLSVVSTGCRNTDEKQIETVADSFSVNFFNWKYVECVPFITPESQKFLSFIASNVTNNNIETLRSMQDGASVERNQIVLSANDSTANVTVNINNICYVDTIGRPAKIYESAEATLLIVKTQAGWKVVVSNDWPKMAIRQQNE
jgi:hypothetical protein